MWEQRFFTDGKLAPCWGYQVDETASVVYGVYTHYEYTKDENAINNDVLSFALLTLLKLVSPVCVFMSEEIYSSLGATQSIHEIPWCEFDENLAKTSSITLIVQVNGKIKDKIEAQDGLSNDELEKLAEKSEKVSEAIKGKAIVKTIVVPNKLVNIVVK